MTRLAIYDLSMFNLIAAQFVLFFALNSLAQAQYAPFKISKTVHENSEIRFKPHKGPGPFDNYLTLEVQFSPVADVFRQLLLLERTTLTNRGEAHITVITPNEYNDVLKKFISIEEIDSIALAENIQNAKFQLTCMGVGALAIDGKIERTFFLVSPSEDLLRIRRRIRAAYVANALDKGSVVRDFDAEKFYPHITVGYTLRDLHYEKDGVVKDADSCAYGITELKY